MQATPKIWWRHRAAAIAAQLVKVRDVHDINWILMNARNGLGHSTKGAQQLRRFGCVVIMGVTIWLGDRFNLRTGQFRSSPAMTEWELWAHSSLTRGFCSMKFFSELIQNLPYLFHVLENPCSSFFPFCNFEFYLINTYVNNQHRSQHNGNTFIRWKLHKLKKKHLSFLTHKVL